MVIWKWICKHNLFVKIIGIIIYFYLCIFLIDVVVSVVFFFKKMNIESEIQSKNYAVASHVEKIIKDDFDKKDNEFMESAALKISKNIQLSTCDFLIDVENKKFGFYIPTCHSVQYLDIVKDLIYNKIYTMNSANTIVELDSFKDEVLREFSSCTYNVSPCEIYNFSDLIRVEFIDKSRTDEKRTYTMESKSGDAFWGAVGGSLLSETIFNEYATAGAIIGASGERKITENVEKSTHIELCVNVYLNDINNPYKSFTFRNENELREFIGALEYIKNNK